MIQDSKQFDEEKMEALRRQAEDYLAGSPAGTTGALVSDMQNLLHELEVHRIELQLQNEDLRATQCELEAARLAYADLYDFAPVGYLTIDEKGSISAANLTAASLLGVKHGGLLAKPLSRFVLPEDRDALYHHTRAVLESPVQLECTLRMQDAENKTFHARLVSAAWNVDGEKSMWRTVFSDVSQLVQAEIALRAAQKLAGLGLLSAGIAHEINSPLQVITGLSERLVRRLPAGEIEQEQLIQDLDTLNRNAWRIAGITRSLLTYARQNEVRECQEVDLSALVEETLKLVEYQLEKSNNITVVKELASDLPACTCNPGEISQVLINLVTNAADAIGSGGGTITIRTRYDPETQLVTLQVSDSGQGISKGQLAQIFEPFFTTKAVGAGVGLGLSVSKGIIEAHGGRIEVNSAPDRGATFTIHLPLQPPPGVVNNAHKGRY